MTYISDLVDQGYTEDEAHTMQALDDPTRYILKGFPPGTGIAFQRRSAEIKIGGTGVVLHLPWPNDYSFRDLDVVGDRFRQLSAIAEARDELWDLAEHLVSELAKTRKSLDALDQV